MDESLRAWVHAELGVGWDVDPLPVNGRKHGRGQRVRRVVDGHGTPWVLKQVAVAREWEAEHHAYAHWVPRLADGAPSLRAADRGLRTFLVSEVAGRHPTATRRHTHRHAGGLLRRLHDAARPRPRSGADRAALLERLRRLSSEARDVLDPGERAFVQGQGEAVADLSLAAAAVPCHGDYRSHNWVVDDAGTLRVIDFGKARWEQPAWDLAKLFLRPWWRRPRLADAFLQGYGRSLRPDEADYVQCRVALDALSHAAFGATRRSDRHVRFARAKLSDLMDGHRVVTPSMVGR